MNYDEVMALDEQRLAEAVLRAQGWKLLPNLGISIRRGALKMPDYLHDLNACFGLLKGRVYAIWDDADGESNVSIHGNDPGESYLGQGATLNVAILRAYLLAREE